MTNGQYQELVEFLAGKFEGIDKRFDGVDRRFDAVDRRFDAVDRRFDAVEERLGGVEGRLGGVEGRLGGVEGRLGGLEQRTAAVEVGLESLRDEVRVVAEGVQANSARIDRLETTMTGRFDRMEELWFDHDGRIRALEDS